MKVVVTGDLSKKFKEIVKKDPDSVLSEESVQRWSETLKGLPIGYFENLKRASWAHRVPEEYWQSRTASTKEWKIKYDPPIEYWHGLYTNGVSPREYQMDNEYYKITITYFMLSGSLDIDIEYLPTHEHKQYNKLSKAYIMELFDINNLLYRIDNVYVCKECGAKIIIDRNVSPHKELCIANVLDSIEEQWENIG